MIEKRSSQLVYIRKNVKLIMGKGYESDEALVIFMVQHYESKYSMKTIIFYDYFYMDHHKLSSYVNIARIKNKKLLK